MKDITLVVVIFDGNEKKLNTILNMCQEKQLYVLLPYFANEFDSDPSIDKAEPEQMSRAHRCVIERTKERKEAANGEAKKINDHIGYLKNQVDNGRYKTTTDKKSGIIDKNLTEKANLKGRT